MNFLSLKFSSICHGDKLKCIVKLKPPLCLKKEEFKMSPVTICKHEFGMTFILLDMNSLFWIAITDVFNTVVLIVSIHYFSMIMDHKLPASINYSNYFLFHSKKRLSWDDPYYSVVEPYHLKNDSHSSPFLFSKRQRCLMMS